MRQPPTAGALRPRADWRTWPLFRTLFAPRAPVHGGGRDWLSTVLGAALLLGFAVLMGIEYLNPDKRVLAVLAAIVIFGVTWRLDLVSGLGVLVLALPYPRGTTFGSTNLALVLLLLVIWLLRATLRQAPVPHRTPVDAPIAALLLSFTVSFYNVQPATLGWAIGNYLLLLACLGMFYVIVNNVRRPEQLERLHMFQVVSIAMVCLFGVFELRFPNAKLVPGWIEFHQEVSEAINLHNVRIGGPFFDFELLSEYCAMNLMLLLFLLLRARSMMRRVIYSGLLAMMILIMFATVTRGGILAVLLGLGYMAWLLRRRITAVAAGITLVGVAVGVLCVNYYVATYTYSGDLFKRMLDRTSMTFIDGMPASRALLWESAFKRMMEHPLIGHGPVYLTQRTFGFWFWPHNGYLFVGNLVGIIGLSFYIWLLLRLVRLTRPAGTDLFDPNYARAYLFIGHIQLIVFMVDQMKIDFLRNQSYQFQVWLFFAYIVAAYQASRAPTTAPEPVRGRS